MNKGRITSPNHSLLLRWNFPAQLAELKTSQNSIIDVNCTFGPHLRCMYPGRFAGAEIFLHDVGRLRGEGDFG